jgi:hypothetical protein
MNFEPPIPRFFRGSSGSDAREKFSRRSVSFADSARDACGLCAGRFSLCICCFEA